MSIQNSFAFLPGPFPALPLSLCKPAQRSTPNTTSPARTIPTLTLAPNNIANASPKTQSPAVESPSSSPRPFGPRHLGKLLILGDSTIASARKMDSIDATFYDGPDAVIDHLRHALTRYFTIVDGTLIARTLSLDDPTVPRRIGSADAFNGRKALQNHLNSSTFAAVVLALGTNDLRNPHNRTKHEILTDLSNLVSDIRRAHEDTHVILVSPPRINLDFINEYHFPFVSHCAHRPDEVFPIYEYVAQRFGVSLFDGRKLGLPQSGDGVHLSTGQNRLYAQQLIRELDELFELRTGVLHAKSFEASTAVDDVAYPQI